MYRKSLGNSDEKSNEIVPTVARNLSIPLFLFLFCSFTPISWAFLIPSTHHNTRRSSPFRRVDSSPRRILHSSDDQCDLKIPRHVAFICDGNARWARERCLPTAAGHVVGADRFIELIEYLQTDGIEYCTFFGFSTENWKRSEDEIQSIFDLMEQTAKKLSMQFPPETSEVEIRFLGDLDDRRIPAGLREALLHLQEENEKRRLMICQSGVSSAPLTINLALNYGGRQDILRATKKVAIALKDGKFETPDDITEEVFASFLDTAGIPDPDMIIRTSGESRLSNFLLWNCAYSEIYISPAMWPDFDRNCWLEAIIWYQKRLRRFGSREYIEDRVGFNARKTRSDDASLL